MKKESHIAALSRFNTKNVSMDQFDPAGGWKVGGNYGNQTP